MRVWVRAALAQASALIVVFLFGIPASKFGISPALWQVLAVQGVLAALFGLAYSLPTWWLPIQCLFFPAAVLLLIRGFPSTYYLVAFGLLWLVFRSNPKERVPLYLSNPTAWKALADLLPDRQDVRFMDLGAGLGGVVSHLARSRPNGRFLGVESAPLPCCLAWLRLCLHPNGGVRWGTLWDENLAEYDVVYAFLSPEPMTRLWEKARLEMRPGSMLVSNSFEIPGVVPDRILVLKDRRRTRLLIWAL